MLAVLLLALLGSTLAVYPGGDEGTMMHSGQNHYTMDGLGNLLCND